MRDMQAMSSMGMGAAAGPQLGPTGQPADMAKVFLGEKENLDLAEHEWNLENVETRLLVKYGKLDKSVLMEEKEARAIAASSSSSSSKWSSTTTTTTTTTTTSGNGSPAKVTTKTTKKTKRS